MSFTKKKKIIIAVVGVAVVVIGGKLLLGGGGADTAGPVVTTAFAERQSLEEVIKLKAVLEGTDSTEIVSKRHYEVEQVLVNEGDKVVAGQVLAILDDSDINDELSVARNEHALLELEQQDTLEDRQAKYEDAKKAYDDTKALFDIGAASQDELTAAKRALDDIPSENGKAVLSAAEKQTLANSSQKLKIQAQALEDCQVRSVIDGTVTRVNTTVGRFADETDDDKPMFVVENVDKIQMKVSVDEKDIAKIEVGQSVDITADILGGESVSGEVVRISPTGETKEGSATERVVPVYIEVTETNDKLITGITANASINIAKAENALSVPYEAISEQEDGTTVVYVVNEDSTIHIVPVVTGLETDLYVEIKEGELTEGAHIVLNPDLMLTEGMTVTAM